MNPLSCPVGGKFADKYKNGGTYVLSIQTLVEEERAITRLPSGFEIRY